MDLERQLSELADRVTALEAAARSRPPLPSASASAESHQAVTPAGPTFVPVERTFAPGSQVPPPPPSGAMPIPQTEVPPPPGWAPVEHRRPNAFEWGIESLLRWAGVALVSLAAIFLVSTAITRGWIGPELQLFAAALGGAALLAAATRYAESRRPWALALGCGGAVVLAACGLATHEWLDVVGPGPAVVLVAIATVVSCIIAVHTRLEGIALTASLVGMFAPLDTLDGFGAGAVLAWVAAFIVGSSALGLLKTWPGLRLATGWLGALVLMAYALSEDVEGVLQVMGFVGTAIIGVTLWVGPTLAHQLSPSTGAGSWGSFDWTPVDYRLVALVPAWVWAVVAGLLPIAEDRHYGIVALVTAAGFLGLAELTFGRVPRIVSLSTFLGALSLLAVGFAIYLDGPALMVALAGQAITSYFLARKLDDQLLRYGSYGVGLIASLLAVGDMLRAIEQDGFENAGHVLATALLVLCWVAAAVAVRKQGDDDIPFELPLIGAWGGAMLWFGAVLTGVPQGLLLISLAWTAMACGGLILGLTRRIAVIKNVALATLAITLAKLVTVDLAEVDVFWRVGLFFVVGMGLIALGLKVPSLIGSSTNESPAPEGEPEHSVSTF